MILKLSSNVYNKRIYIYILKVKYTSFKCSSLNITKCPNFTCSLPICGYKISLAAAISFPSAGSRLFLGYQDMLTLRRTAPSNPLSGCEREMGIGCVREMGRLLATAICSPLFAVKLLQQLLLIRSIFADARNKNENSANKLLAKVQQAKGGKY